MSLTRHIAWILAGGAVLGWCFAMPRPEHAPESFSRIKQVETAIATYGVDTRTIELKGTFIAADGGQVPVGSALSGKVQKILVKQGDHVKAGQVLAVVEPGVVLRSSAPIVNSTSEAKRAEQLSDALGSALTSHQTALDNAQRAYEKVKTEHDERISQARSEMEKSVSGAPSDQVQDAKHDVDKARGLRDKAKALADRNQHAYEEGWISRNQATASKNAFEIADGKLQAAEDRLKELKKGASESEAAAARAAFAKIKATEDKKLENARAELVRIQEGGLAYGSGDRIAMPSFRTFDSSGLKGKIGKRMEVKAPCDGVVLKVAEPGKPNLFEILKDGAKCEFLAQVDLATAKQVVLGTVVRLPRGETAAVTAIGVADPKTGLSPIHIVCQPQTKLGEPALATVELSTVAKQVSVPSTALIRSGNEVYVFTISGSVAHRTSVVLGSLKGGQAEVLNGLKQGSTVVATGLEDLREGDKVSVLN